MPWIVLAVVGGLIAAVRIARKGLRKGGQPDVGAVSDQWVAQHRADPPHQ